MNILLEKYKSSANFQSEGFFRYTWCLGTNPIAGYGKPGQAQAPAGKTDDYLNMRVYTVQFKNDG